MRHQHALREQPPTSQTYSVFFGPVDLASPLTKLHLWPWCLQGEKTTLTCRKGEDGLKTVSLAESMPVEEEAFSELSREER
ncbi:hypothetical protein CDAR_604181 [Caerostris darwini]|uniref:Uncharacterized protein n=1 Tax=Caerostris darwini TaxID=1538125 RepID=A0AAV4SFT4_9ARAC|nr:hypothetical protein CDAR_604181 [Caerostris darwini]